MQRCRHRSLGRLLLVLFSSAGGTRAVAQVVRIPTALELTTETREVEVGRPVSVTVRIKNFNNQYIAAGDPVSVVVTSNLTESMRLTIPVGQTSVQTEMRFPTPGVAKIEASSAMLTSAYSVVVAKPSSAARAAPSPRVPMAAPSERPSTLRPAPPPPIAPSPPASSAVRPSPAPAPGARSTQPEPTPLVEDAGAAERFRAKRAVAEREATVPREERRAAGAPGRAERRTSGALTVETTSSASPVAVERTTAVVAAAAPSPPAYTLGPAPVGPPSEPGLHLEVLPFDIHPRAAKWRAEVWVVAVDHEGRPTAAAAPVPVRLAATLGALAPTQVLIAAGDVRPPDAIQLTSSKPGREKVWAWSDVSGKTVAAEAVFHEALPSQMRVVAQPSRAVNSGKSLVRVTVILLDDANTPASYPQQDLNVTLTSSLGTLEPRVLPIAKGSISGEALLTSTATGRTVVKASALHLPDAEASVTFLFPWLMIGLAAAGGWLGATFRSGKLQFSRLWGPHLGANLLSGLVLGVIFYALAWFGIPALIPQATLPMKDIPTANELGAFLLGFLGGYYGRAWLPAGSR